jgi:two-component system, OmpR family, alkaline phosphatase synthesis response regulator PhoP
VKTTYRTDSSRRKSADTFRVMHTKTASSVLVVDDEPQVVWMLQFSLEAEGYQTLAAKDGKAALDEVREHHPSVVLLDIMMPVMDGWSFLEELQEIPASERPRVIVVSARSSLRDRAKAAELGADAFVAKPFNVDDLLLVLHDVEQAS